MQYRGRSTRIWTQITPFMSTSFCSFGMFIAPVFSEWKYYSQSNCLLRNHISQGPHSFVKPSEPKSLNNFNWMFALFYWIFKGPYPTILSQETEAKIKKQSDMQDLRERKTWWMCFLSLDVLLSWRMMPTHWLQDNWLHVDSNWEQPWC